MLCLKYVVVSAQHAMWPSAHQPLSFPLMYLTLTNQYHDIRL